MLLADATMDFLPLGQLSRSISLHVPDLYTAELLELCVVLSQVGSRTTASFSCLFAHQFHLLTVYDGNAQESLSFPP